MKRILNSTVIALVAFLLVGSIPVMAIERPFALNGKGIGIFTVDADGVPISADVTSTSNATHLGLCTTVGKVIYTRANDPEHPGRLLSNGSGTITAANGDVVQIEFSGVLDPPAPGSTTGIDTP